MNVKLSAEEAQNVKVALMQLAKAQNTNEQAMFYLLNLSSKFNPEPAEKPIEIRGDT